MANFDDAIAFVLGNESGALLDDPATGEYSRWGVTLTLAAALGLCASDERTFIDDLTESAAKGIYRQHFWDPMLLDGASAQQVAATLLDMGVNMGVPRAVRIAQVALNGLGSALSVDGKMGTHTLHELNRFNPFLLVEQMRAGSTEFTRCWRLAIPKSTARISPDGSPGQGSKRSRFVA